MPAKTRLELDRLEVDSFATTEAPAGARGTVRGRDAGDCTCFGSCLCPTAAYFCATVMETAVSCDYTNNDSCVYETQTCGGESCDRPCMDTETC